MYYTIPQPSIQRRLKHTEAFSQKRLRCILWTWAFRILQFDWWWSSYPGWADGRRLSGIDSSLPPTYMDHGREKWDIFSKLPLFFCGCREVVWMLSRQELLMFVSFPCWSCFTLAYLLAPNSLCQFFFFLLQGVCFLELHAQHRRTQVKHFLSTPPVRRDKTSRGDTCDNFSVCSASLYNECLIEVLMSEGTWKFRSFWHEVVLSFIFWFFSFAF